MTGVAQSARVHTHIRRQMSRRRIGFCLSEKKRRRMNLRAFADLCAGYGVEVVELDRGDFCTVLLSCMRNALFEMKPLKENCCNLMLKHSVIEDIDITQLLEPQGPFDVIVHKLSDVMVEAERDSRSRQLLANFQSYVSAHPETVLLDPLPAMTQLLDRFASYRIMTKLHNSLRDWRICSPPYLEIHGDTDLSSIQQAVINQSLSFPLICKTRVAHGSLSHEMSLIFSACSLADVRPPCVLQSFINHGAVLHKVFVVGDRHFCVERPSLKNFPSGPCDRKTIFFNSHQVSKPESSSDLTALDEQMPYLPPPSSEAVAALVKELRSQLGMALFGVDVIINIHTHTLTVIDINIFPGYEGVPQFFSSLLDHIKSVLKKQIAACPQPAGPPEPSPAPADPSAASTSV